MSVHSEIDGALRQLGSAKPPNGMEERIHGRLADQSRRPSPRFSLPVLYGIGGGALAAGLALSGVALHPAWRSLLLAQHPPAAAGNVRIVPSGGFGAAGIVHVPAEPVPVQPAPVNQGRGHARSGRATLPAVLRRPLPRGVAPTEPAAHAGTATR